MKTKQLCTKIFLMICFSFLAVSFSNAQVRFGVKAGFNASSLSGYEKAVTTLGENAEIGGMLPFDAFSVKYRPGFHAGIVSQIDLAPNFLLQPELLYSLLGVKEETSLLGVKQSETGSLHYIQLPVYAAYKFNVGLNLDLILGAGPYIGCGIAGDDDAFKDTFTRFDWGLSAMGGVQYNKFQITIGYDLGLMDMFNMDGWKTAKDMLGLSSISNRNFKVSVAYFFK
ncbi:MAG: PorT family protein [Candidatus Azobacteroides sp.]|nr:PorT family protein [Candidatus Azobacteroides sp.]